MNIPGDFEQGLRELDKLQYREEFEAALQALYVRSTQHQRGVIRAGVRDGSLKAHQPWKYPTAYGRTDLPQPQRLRHGLIEMSIRGVSSDFRDDLLSLGYYYHQAAMLGIDARVLLEEIAQLSDEKFAELVRGFLSRSPEQNSLKAWGLCVVETPEGPKIDRVL